MKLYIANKNYSSWSMRPWLAMKVLGVSFTETLVPFDDDAGNPAFREFSPSGMVPTLVDGSLTIWESMGILEYLADKYPEAGFWPREMEKRAWARAIANEMHGGFTALRSECPMNLHREISPLEVSPAVRKNVTRIETIWAECLAAHGGPFLFGDFTNADAMFAPVVNRLEKYVLSDHEAVKTYSASMKSLAAWQEWERAALAETWIVPADER